MTGNTSEPYEQLLDNYASQLNAAMVRRNGRQRTRRRATGVALTMGSVAAGVLVLAGAPGGTHIDGLSQARAALGTPGQIVHLVLTEHTEVRGAPKPDIGPLSTHEQWSSTAPSRWRVALTIPTPTTAPDGKPIGNTNGLVTGPMQFSYRAGRSEEYYEQPNTLGITEGVDEQNAQASPTGPLGVEPIARIRSMLAAGRLSKAGTGTANGRPVMRLAGAYPRGTNPPWHVEYDVDPNTYTPVEVAIEVPQPGRPADKGVQTVVLDVDRYEVIPLNQSTEPLLSIKTTGGPTVERR